MKQASEARANGVSYMSKSYRRKAQSNCLGEDTVGGKRRTSRKLRRKVSKREHDALLLPLDFYKDDPTDYDNPVVTRDPRDFFLDDPRDKVRGRAGSRSPDRGWDDFGDGRQRMTDFSKTGRK